MAVSLAQATLGKLCRARRHLGARLETIPCKPYEALQESNSEATARNGVGSALNLSATGPMNCSES